jgi:hypothetical protein
MCCKPLVKVRPSDTRSIDAKLQKSPLHDRAWAFQEHVLSPRVVDFLDADILWLCPKTTFSVSKWSGSIREHSNGIVAHPIHPYRTDYPYRIANFYERVLKPAAFEMQ